MMDLTTIATAGGPLHRVETQTGGSIPPGLGLCWLEDMHCWTITHLDSGQRIGPGFQELREARRAAEQLADLTDWTLPASILLADPNLPLQVDEALWRHCEASYPNKRN